jgi:hypothetical protein
LSLQNIIEYGIGISEALRAARHPPSSSPSSSWRDLVAQESAFWDLLFILFVRLDDSLISQELAAWFRQHTDALISNNSHPLPIRLVEEFNAAAVPESHPLYWSTLKRLIGLGWHEEAVGLLQLHSAWLQWDGNMTSSSVAALDYINNLLKKWPNQSQQGSVGELLAYYKHWRSQCADLASNTTVWQELGVGYPDMADALLTCLKAMSGDKEMVAGCVLDNWVEQLISLLLHVYPSANRQGELLQLIEECVGKYSTPLGHESSSSSSFVFFEAVSTTIEASCDGDPQTALRAASTFASDWFLAHAPPVLAAHPAGKTLLDTELSHAGGSQQEFYNLEYASALAPHSTTMTLAARSLAWCRVHGQAAFVALSKNMPLSVEDWRLVPQEMSSLAIQHGMKSVKKDIWERMAVLAKEEGLEELAKLWSSSSVGGMWAVGTNMDARLNDAVNKLMENQCSTEKDIVQALSNVSNDGSTEAQLVKLANLYLYANQQMHV